MSDGYDKNKDKQIFKDGKNPTGDRWFNVGVFSYDGGAKKIRIMPAGKNRKAEDGDKNRWINQKSITAISKQEALALASLLMTAANHAD